MQSVHDTWEKFRESATGRCWIVGNGPSLADVPAAALALYPSFGANRVFLHPEFRPTFYSAVDANMFKWFGLDWLDELRGKTQVCFLGKDMATPELRERYWPDMDILPLRPEPERKFVYEPEQAVYEGWSITFINLQIAFFMGFTQPILVGVDHRWTVPEGHDPELPYVREGPDPDHFHKDYIPEGIETCHPPGSLWRATQAFKLAEKAYRKAGRLVLNATVDSDLDVFARIDLARIVP